MKNFKDKKGVSRVGEWLKKSAPHLIDLVGDVLPDNGALGIVKNIIKKDSKLSEDQKKEALALIKLDYAGIDSSRDMYTNTEHVMADYIAKRVITYNLWVVLIAVIIEITSVILIDDKVLIAIISSAIASISTALLQERQQVINFFFGSSKGSKDKSKLINGI
mgnify:CR=1 FL=1